MLIIQSECEAQMIKKEEKTDLKEEKPNYKEDDAYLVILWRYFNITVIWYCSILEESKDKSRISPLLSKAILRDIGAKVWFMIWVWYN